MTVNRNTTDFLWRKKDLKESHLSPSTRLWIKQSFSLNGISKNKADCVFETPVYDTFSIIQISKIF